MRFGRRQVKISDGRGAAFVRDGWPGLGTLVVACLACVPGSVGGQGVARAAEESEPPVEVRGETPNGMQWTWTITNRSAYPVNYFELTVFQAVNVFAPPGWEIRQKPKNYRDVTPIIYATEDPEAMIGPGESLSFEVRILKEGPGLGVARSEVKVGFAGHDPVTIGGVLTPRRPSLLDSYGMPAFLALLLVGFVVWRWSRSRGSAGQVGGGGASSDGGAG